MTHGRPTPPLLEVGEYVLSPFFIAASSLTLNIHRRQRGWDYDPQVGLVMAGSGSPKTNVTEISQCGDTTFTDIGAVPFGGQQGTCVVIIDEETVFVAGVMICKSKVLSYY